MRSENTASSPEDWQKMSRGRLASARILLSRGQWKDAFDMAGYAVEYALKYRLMKHLRLNQWPDRAAHTAHLYNHDLVALAKTAGLEESLLQSIQDQNQIGRAWLVAKDWKEDVRYVSTFPSRRSRDMVKAVGDEGLLKWLLT